MVRPKLECAKQSLCPFMTKDKLVIKKVLQKATRLILSLYKLAYYGRSKILKLPFQEYRKNVGL